MTLNRPAYTLTLVNETAGWTATVTQGEVFDPQVRWFLSDPFTMSWMWADRPGGRLQAVTASATIVARTAGDLPAFTIGDYVQLTLSRPTDTQPIVYASWWGNITDADARTRRGGQTTATITIVDVTAAAARLTYTGTLPAGQNPEERAEQLSQDILHVTSRPGGLPTFTLGQVEASNTPVLDLYEALGKSAPFNWNDGPESNSITVLRVDRVPVDGRLALVAAFENYEPEITLTSSPYIFERETPTSDIVTIHASGDPWDTPGLTSIPANAVEHSADWRLGIDSLVNTVTITGIGDPQPVVTRSWSLSVAANGETSWEIPTQLTSLSDQYIGRFLPPAADMTPVWGVDGVPVLTSKLTDADLDRLAPGFFPHLPGVADNPFAAGRPIAQMIAIVGVEPASQLNGPQIYGHLTGAEFAIQDGELSISPHILPTTEFPAVYGGGISWDRLAVDPGIGGTTWADTSTLHIDPDLTWNDLRLASL